MTNGCREEKGSCLLPPQASPGPLPSLWFPADAGLGEAGEAGDEGWMVSPPASLPTLWTPGVHLSTGKGVDIWG